MESIDELKKLWVDITPKEGEPCAYCGVLATDKEHVTPSSWIEKAKELKFAGIEISIPEEIIVPSCRECNLIASARIFETFTEKKNYIRYKLTKKYQKWIFKEQWNDDELNSLSGDLKRHTVLYNEALKAVQARLKRIGAKSILKNMEYFRNLYGN